MLSPCETGPIFQQISVWTALESCRLFERSGARRGTTRTMFIQLIDYAPAVWFALVALSSAYVTYDPWRNNPKRNVMRAGFALVSLYMGPLGLLFYVLADKRAKVWYPMRSSFKPSESRGLAARFIASLGMRPA